ncbi:Protein involved in initiation of plasmid replication [Candidatus Electrothrix gigas]
MNNKKKLSIVVQSNKLVEARYSLTVGEQRLIFAMISLIHSDDVDFFVYEMRVKNLAELLNFDLKYAYFEIEKISERLMQRVLNIREGKGWLKIGWVSSCRYNHETGTVSFKFDPDLKPYLLQLKREFTKSGLLILTKFQSVYSIRIYQLLKQYKGIGYREFGVDELKDILGIGSEKYKRFNQFKVWVLNQAKKEFEKKDESGKFQCDLTFELEKIREGRKIARLKFIIVEQEYHEIQMFIPYVSKKKQTGSQGESVGTPPKGVKDRLVYYGISPKQADGFIREIGEDDIQDVLTYYADMLKAGKVKNTQGAYLAALLRKGVVGKSSYEKDKEAAEALRKKQLELAKQQRELARQRAEEERKLKNLALEERFNSLPKEDQESLLAEFEDSLERFLLKYFYKDGIHSVVIRGNFFEFLEEKFN